MLIHFVSGAVSEHIQHVTGFSGVAIDWGLARLGQRDMYHVQADVLTYATAGQPLVLQLLARDITQSSDPADDSHLFAELQAASIMRLDIHCKVDYEGPGEQRMTVIGQAPGQYNLATFIGTPGIKVSFFENTNFLGSPFSQWLVESVEWDSALDLQGEAILPAGIRWEGAIRPGLPGNYFFSLEVRVDGRLVDTDVCLKIANTFHLGCKDQGWRSQTQKPVRLSTLKFERFVLEIVKPPPGRLQLWWHSPQLMKETVPTGVLFALLPIQQSALQIRVIPGNASAHESTSTKAPPMIAPGEEVSVLTETRDEYGTVTDAPSTMVAVTARHLAAGVRNRNTLAVRTDVGNYEASLVLHTVSGLVSLSSSLLECTGIHTTYYADAIFSPSAAVKTATVSTIDFSALAHRAPTGSSLASCSSHSIRWAGMLRPLHAHTYTMYLARQQLTERVKLWVDNVLIVDAWNSLGVANEMSGTLAFGVAEHVYDITLQYRVGITGNSGLGLQWSTLGGGRESPLLCTAHRLRASMIEILPGLPLASSSVLTRCSSDRRDVVFAGHQLCFQILLRDQWENLAQPNMSNIEVSGRDQFEQMIHLDHFVQTAPAEISLVFTVTASGRFSTHVKIAGNHVSGSPISVQVNAGIASPSSWQYRGAALTLSTAGVMSFFTVYAADEHGNTVSNTKVSFSGLYPVKPSEPDTCASKNHTFQITEGQIQLQYLVTSSGKFQADLSSSGMILRGSPFTCTVEPSLVDAAASYIKGDGLTVTTAGIHSSFVITARDVFGNKVSSAANYLDVSIRRPGARDVAVQLEHRSEGEYVATYQTHVAGISSIRSFVVIMGGIHATYFSASDLHPATAVKAAVLNAIDFSAPQFQSPSISSLPVNSSFSVRWAGNLYPPLAYNYTLYAARKTVEERVKVWVDNILLIDMWSSLTSNMEMSGTLAIDTVGGFYAIKVEYSKMSTHGNCGVALFWRGANHSKVVVPASALGRANAIESEFPILTTRTQLFCASTSSISGSGMTVLTAGITASLTIISRDEFHNVRADDVILLGVSRDMGIGIALLTVSGSYTQRIDVSGISQTRYTGMVSGGLSATYYSNRLLTLPVSTRKEVAIGEDVEAISDYMGARWSGYLIPTLSDIYTFHLSTSSFANFSLYDSARTLLLSLSSDAGIPDHLSEFASLAAGSVYTIDIIYWHVTGKARLSLQWSSILTSQTRQQAIHKSNLLSRLDLQGSPSHTSVKTSLLCTSTSLLAGPGLTAVTAGGVMIFYITTRDQFSNRLGTIAREPIIVDYVPHSRSTRAVRAISSYNSLGEWDILILGLTVSGSYKILVSLATYGGIWATYFDISSFSPTAVATTKHTRLSVTTNASAFLATVLPTAAFSVVWKGFISSPVLLRNFSVAVGGTDERVRMWIDNLVVIDQWNSLHSTSITSPAAFLFQDVSTPYMLEIEYRQSTGNYSFDLRWNRDSNHSSIVTFDPVPASHLFTLKPFADSPYDTVAQSSFEFGEYAAYTCVSE